MKKILLIIAIVALTPLMLMAQQEKGYEITGRIAGLKDGERVSMWVWSYRGKGNFNDYFRFADSGYVKNGSFHIAGVVPEGPRTYNLRFDQHPEKIASLSINNNEHITITGDIDKIQHGIIEKYLTIEGSPTNYSMDALKLAEWQYWQSVARINKSIKQLNDSIGFNGPLFDMLFKARNSVTKAFETGLFVGSDEPYIKNANILLPTSFSSFITSKNASFWMPFYQSLDAQTKNSFYGKWLGDMVKFCIGQPFPEFTLPTPEGKILSLKDVTSKGKLTIVHFWADKSYRIDYYQKELKVFYKKYHDKGLNIVAVSSDKYADQWKDAIQRYQLSLWYHVSDLKGANGIVDKVYNEYGDPKNDTRNTTNVLIDAQGKIVAWDVDGVELQWYLWKIFGE